MSISGMRDTSGFTEGNRPKNFREGLLLLYRHGYGEGTAPLTALTSLMKKRNVNDPEFYWWTKSMSNRRFRLHATNGDLSAVAGVQKLVFEASNHANFHDVKELKEGDILYVEQTGERVRIHADPVNSTELWVQRGFAGTTPEAVDADGAGVNPFLVAVGSAFEEGSNAPTGVARSPVKLYNYTQIFRSTIEMTRTAMKTRLRTKEDIAEAKRESMEMLGTDLERAFFFGGARWEGQKNGKPIRTFGSIRSFMPAANDVAATNGEIDMDGFEALMFQAFRNGSSEKMAFVGDGALLTMNQVVRKNTAYQVSGIVKEYGMDVKRFSTPYGQLVLKRHPLFSDMTGGTNNGQAFYSATNWLFIVDQTRLSYVYLDGSDIKYESKLETNGMDGEKSGWLGEVSIEVHDPDANFLIRNLGRGIADTVEE